MPNAIREENMWDERYDTKALSEAPASETFKCNTISSKFHILYPSLKSFYVKGIEIMIFETLSIEEAIFSSSKFQEDCQGQRGIKENWNYPCC